MRFSDYYKWIAVLDDGEVLEQTTPSAIRFTDSDPLYPRIKQFILTKKYDDDVYLNNISIDIHPNEKLKYFRRTVVNTKTNNTFEIYLVGVYDGQCSFVFPDGHVELTSNDDPSYLNDFINIYNI